MTDQRIFSIVPLEAARDHRLTAAQYRLLIALLSFRNKRGDLVWPKRSRLCELTGYTERSVSKYTSQLVKLGWLVKRGAGGRSMGCYYEITVPDIPMPEVETVSEEITVSQVNMGVDNRETPSETVSNPDRVLPSETLSNPETVSNLETVSNPDTVSAKTLSNPDTKTLSNLDRGKEQTKEQTIGGTDQGEHTRARTRDAHAPRRETPRARGTRLPDDWTLPDDWRHWAMQEQPTWTPGHCERVAASFRDYWVAIPGQRGTKRDWFATWRNWVRREGPLKSGAGRIDNVNRQIALEERNRLATANWRPPEIRKAAGGE